MFFTLDNLSFLFWSLTYVLVIIYNIKYHITGIPPIALASNFGWETVTFLSALYFDSFFHMGYFVWFLIDLVIVVTFFLFCKPIYTRHKYNLLFLYMASMTLFGLLSLYINRDSLVVGAFCIDFTMQLEWFYYCASKKFILSPIANGFCLTKLLGDMFAWLIFMRESGFIALLGFIVLVLNIMCLYTALFRDQIMNSRRKR